MTHDEQVQHAVALATAHMAQHPTPSGEVPALLRTIYDAIGALAAVGEPAVERPSPAQVRASIRPDGIVSFIDGRSYKSMKRHLTAHGLDPASYRARYGLPVDYPMVAAAYSAKRSALSKAIGLGQPGGPRPIQAAA